MDIDKTDYKRASIGLGVVLLVVMLIFFFFTGPNESIVSYKEFCGVMENNLGKIEIVAIRESMGIYQLRAKIQDDPKIYISRILKDDESLHEFKEWISQYPEIADKYRPLEREVPFNWLGLLPLIFFVGIAVLVIWYLRRMKGGGHMSGFTKSKARTSGSEVRFSDVAGIDEAMEEVREVVEFLKEEEKFSSVGARVPKGIILMGHPGTGKTLLAKAIAGEAEVPFFEISGSEFVEMFVGVGAGRVRDLFAQAKKNTPCIIFVDEIDAMGKQRGAGVGQTHNEGEQTLNQLFVEMDGFEFNQGIMVLAATNRPDTLDTALLRPGRFDRHVVIDMPNIKGREDILRIYVGKIKVSKDVDLNKLARGTPGYSGAQLEKIVNEAAILAARNNKKSVGMEELWTAKDREDMGLERRGDLGEETRTITAYHEAGHAMVACFVPGYPLDKVTIRARGKALGHTGLIPLDDHHLYTKEFLLAQIKIYLGGRIAEEIIFGKDKITTGAHGDLTYITRMARRMVAEWAMSDKLPLRVFDEEHEMTFLGRDIGRKRNYSEAIAQQLDEESQEIIDECKKGVNAILKAREKELREIANLLLEEETITGEEVRKIVGV